MVFLLAFLIMLLLVAGMAVGAMAGREPLKGSCGGLAAIGIEGRCEICGDDPARCESGSDTQPAPARRADFYDASRPR